ncbi:hypothetical protein GCM10009616_21120 [Microlunatus lacustris]
MTASVQAGTLYDVKDRQAAGPWLPEPGWHGRRRSYWSDALPISPLVMIKGLAALGPATRVLGPLRAAPPDLPPRRPFTDETTSSGGQLLAVTHLEVLIAAPPSSPPPHSRFDGSSWLPFVVKVS